MRLDSALAIVLGVVLAGLASADAPKKKASEPSLPSGSLVPVPGYRARIGDEVQLYYRDSRGNLRDVIVGLTGQALDAALVAIRAGDPPGLAQLEKANRILSLPSGTFVRILEAGDIASERNGYYEAENDSIRVRILNGTHKGKEVFAHPRSVQQLRELAPTAKKIGRRTR